MQPLQQEWLDKHFANTSYHIHLFRIAARALNAIIDSDHRRYGLAALIPDEEIEQHDICKFSEEEAPHYARNFYGPKDDPEGFAGAWAHHLANTKHHWNSYVFEGVTTEMPLSMASAMIADWLAAGRGYQGTWDMGEWLCTSIGGFTPRTLLHRNTHDHINNLLRGIGYITDLDNCALYGLYSRHFEKLLITLEDIYLDPMLDEDDLYLQLKLRCAGQPQKDVAAALGISTQYLTDLLYRRRSISAEMAAKLGYERRVVFVPSKEAA